MTLTPYLKREAESDLLAAIQWYQDRAGLGFELYAEFSTLMTVLCETPWLFIEYEGSIRRALLKRFPYAIYYQVESPRLIIHAVLHMKRHKDAWRGK